jgi:hypothetical protein
VGLAPTGKRRLVTAHTRNNISVAASFVWRCLSGSRFVHHVQVDDARHELPPANHSGVLDRMASALVLMLATHLGEPLQPASVPRGNLRFSTDGRALGSAAVKVDDGTLLTDWDRPDHWDVDALILSGSSEVKVAGPDDTVLNAGDPGTGLSVARRVKPAIVRNDEGWRNALKSSLPAWKDAVEEEFRLWRERQDKERERVLA